MAPAYEYVKVSTPHRAAVQRVLTQRQEALSRLTACLSGWGPEEQQRILSAACTRACESVRERELDIMRHEHFERPDDAARCREKLHRIEAERDLLSGLHYFLKFFQIDLGTVLQPAQREAQAHLIMLEETLAAQTVKR